MSTRTWLAFALSFAVLLFLPLAGCKTTDQPGAVDDGIYNPYQVPLDPVFVVKSVPTKRGADRKDVRVGKIPAKDIWIDRRVEKKPPEPRPEAKPGKISPVLREWLTTKEAGEEIEVLVVLKDDMRIPRLPELQPGEDRERGPTRRARAIEDLKRKREASLKAALDGLQREGRFQVRETFWIIKGAVVTMRLGDVESLAKFDSVAYLQPRLGGEKPPQDANNNNDAQDGRARIVSDPYYNLGLTTPWIGLLDTGVRDTHQMFNSPDHIAWMRDCVNGGPNGDDTSDPDFDPTDFAWNHGTCSAGILTGNARLGNQYRGVTEILTDSWQIYTATGLDSGAAVDAIQAGIAAYDKVLVGEIQANETETGAIATAADNAYDAGVIFVAANGNYGPNSDTVASPGLAHKVLGVGGFMTDGGAQYNNQGRGPAPDGRYKPDIQAPTWSETASATSDTALKVFTGTSGATPYAAASAMLARNWLHRFGTWDNGQTYAFMILYGQNPWPYDNTEGAGPIRMATNGWAYWGKVVVLDKQNIDIAIGVSAGKDDFDAALWWPESESQDHNDIDVHLIDPSGTERAKGYSGVSVFERARVDGSLTPGTWKLRIRGYHVRTSSQLVYWAAHIRN